jgi:hypothetical protein
MMDRHCDKCGRLVPPHNNAVNFEQILAGSGDTLIADSRHLLPVTENGKVVCEGSPSRAQYFPGQPRDPRPGHKYNPTRARNVIWAIKEFKEKYPEPVEGI